MTRRRFYAPPTAFAADGTVVVLSEEESRHLRDVLRLRAGEEAFVFDGEGREFACVVTAPGGRREPARLEVHSPASPPHPESPLSLTLAVALLKGEKFDLVVQKATELGVSRIVPVLTKRADVRLRDERDADGRVERWRRHALEAAKQSGRAVVPPVTAPVAFDSLVGAQGEGATRLLFAERGGGALDTLVDETHAPPASAVALVGPEGGWDEDELLLAREWGWTLVTLGGRTLRAETAAIAVCVLLQNLWGDLN
jgi:16S rRNA (uracil1498-N3)-methyltransferase